MTVAAAGRRHDLPTIAAVGATLLWGAGNLLASAAPIDGPQLAFWRILLGAVLYQSVLAARGGRMSLRTFRTSLLGGIGFGGSATLFFTALQTTSVTSAAVIGALQPVLLLPVSASRYGEAVTARRLSLVVPTVAGTLVVVAGSSGGGEWSLAGDLAALGGTVLGCLYFVGTKEARAELDTLEYQAAALTIGAATALPSALVLGDGFAVPVGAQWWWPVVMTLVPGTGHLLMSWAQRGLSVSFTSTVGLAVVVVSSLGAAVFFDQGLTWLQLVGMAVVLASLARFVRDQRERVDPVAEEL